MVQKDEILKMEKRRYPRLNDNIFISYQSGAKVFKAITRNISGGGLMFEAEKKIQAGAVLDMEIYQPANSFKTLIFVTPVSVKVRWIKKIKYGFLETGENEYKIGVEFDNIRSEDRKKIEQYVNTNII